MRLNLFALLLLPAVYFAQESTTENSSQNYPNTFSSGSSNIKKFDNAARRFNDWSISVGGGTALLQSADLTSINKDGKNFGWNAYVSLDKQISHPFGLSLQYQLGETHQTGRLPNNLYGLAQATTRYHQISLLGDMNFSNLFRRVDNHSPYRWAIHGYAGIGLQGYRYHRTDEKGPTLLNNGTYIWETTRDFTQPLRIDSFFYQGGAGVAYKISRRVDIEGRVMYVITGDEEFDGGGETRKEWPGYNLINDNYTDNMVIANLGLRFKIGKHISHLTWHDPLQEVYYRTEQLEKNSGDLVVCEKGDGDNDGVCDDWDRQLDTPAGARVDGAGVALDMDLDGVIDLHDRCVTVPGPASNNGCPEKPVVNTSAAVTEINKDFEGIEFELDKDVIRSQSYDRLNHAADVIKTLDPTYKFLVVGATDTRGSESYNLNLSQRRAAAVVKYLVDRGVNAGMLVPEGRGETDLKYPECNPATKCPEWKNEANRRVYFLQK